MIIECDSGKFAAETSVEQENHNGRAWPYIRIVLRDRRTGTATSLDQRYPAWFSLAVGWDDDDRLWVHSGDTGMNIYEHAAGNWLRQLWDSAGTEQALPVYDVSSGKHLDVSGGIAPPTMTRVSHA